MKKFPSGSSAFHLSIPRGVEVKKLRSMVPRLSSDIYTGYTDNVYLPLTDIVFPTVPNYHKDEAPLDMLAALMGDGKKSIFYKNFVKSEKEPFKITRAPL